MVFLIESDAPEVTLIGTPTVDLEENIDSVSLRCRADANPPATVIWRRVGGNPSMTNKAPVASMGDIYSFQEILEFSPVTRKDSATYSCEAKNTIGTSNLITIPIDIKCKSQSSNLSTTFFCSPLVFLLLLRPPLDGRVVRETPPNKFRWNSTDEKFFLFK